MAARNKSQKERLSILVISLNLYPQLYAWAGDTSWGLLRAGQCARSLTSKVSSLKLAPHRLGLWLFYLMSVIRLKYITLPAITSDKRCWNGNLTNGHCSNKGLYTCRNSESGKWCVAPFTNYHSGFQSFNGIDFILVKIEL